MIYPSAGNPREPLAGPAVGELLSAPSKPDEDPLLALSQGRTAPFEAFVHTQAPRLVGFFLRLGAQRPEAEDLCQDTFLKMFQSAQSYRPQGKPEAYALRIARNAWIDRRRREAIRPWHARYQTRDELEVQPHDRLTSKETSPQRAASTLEEMGRLQQGVATLPDGQREVFEMGVLQEMGYAQISELLQIPVGTVKSRMFNAVRRLREFLGEGGDHS